VILVGDDCAVMYERWNNGQDSLAFHEACMKAICALDGNAVRILSAVPWNWKQAGHP
jgi:hypothetical protein